MTKEGVRKAGWNDETERRSFFRDCKCGSYFENPNIYIYRILIIIIIIVREKYRQTEKCSNYHALALFLFVKVSLSLLPSIPNSRDHFWKSFTIAILVIFPQ